MADAEWVRRQAAVSLGRLWPRLDARVRAQASVTPAEWWEFESRLRREWERLFGLLFALLTALAALFVGDNGPFVGPWDAVIGMCVGAGAISVVGWLGEVWLKRPAMGFGDVTLMAVVGAAVGGPRALLTIFVASVLAPIVLLGVVYPLSARGLADDKGQTELALEADSGWRKRELPFGVFLAPAALITLLWGDAIIAWYLRISGL